MFAENAMIFARGVGKGRKGQGNPRGADGAQLKCHNCGSIERLKRESPKGKSVGQPTGPRVSTQAAYAPEPQIVLNEESQWSESLVRTLE